jgi:thiamine biosynthesis lipoprotein
VCYGIARGKHYGGPKELGSIPLKRKSNRREFLQGHAALDAVGDLADAAPWDLPPDADSTRVEGTSYLMHVSRRAMACQFEVFFNQGQYAQAAEVALEALDLVEALESQLTVYRDDSELMRLNRTAAEGPVEVEPRLFQLLQLAEQIHRDTQGAFDITSGPLSKTWGFYRRQGAIPDDAALEEALTRVGFEHLELDAETLSVRLARAGLELNLGGIGKGYALDRCAEFMGASGVDDFLWHGGQSSVLARGNHDPDQEALSGWVVGVRHPLRPQQRLLEIRLRNQALGTSGTAVQFFRHGGKRYGHILDPRTGRPAESVHCSTVVTADAARADALATAFYVLGPDGAEAYCHDHEDVGYVLVLPGSRAQGIEIVSGGIADEDLRLCE